MFAKRASRSKIGGKIASPCILPYKNPSWRPLPGPLPMPLDPHLYLLVTTRILREGRVMPAQWWEYSTSRLIDCWLGSSCLDRR